MKAMEAMEEMMNGSCRDFIGALSAAQPVPGGGGAAAFGGALGMALTNMLANYTIGKKKYADVEPEVKSLLERGMAIQEQMIDLVAKDALCFAPLSRCYGLPVSTEEEKAYKKEMLSKESKNACSVPYAIAVLAVEALEISGRLAEIGSRLVLSDVGCGAVFLRAALESAWLNVVINLGSITDTDWAAEKQQSIDALLAKGRTLADSCYRAVQEKIG